MMTKLPSGVGVTLSMRVGCLLNASGFMRISCIGALSAEALAHSMRQRVRKVSTRKKRFMGVPPYLL